jgi:hypothetical protein
LISPSVSVHNKEITMKFRKIADFVGICAVLAATVVGMGASAEPVAAVAAEQGPGNKNGGKTQLIRFDVSEDMTRFVFDQNVVHEDGMPAHGSNFITQGYIYEYGTLQDGSDGVNADGSPQYPDKVIGEWTCRGYFVGEGAHATTGPMVITTQLYNFGDTLGARLLVSEGYELADVGVAIQRAITGGTGEYASASGEASQTFLGFNATEGVNLRFELTVRK